MCRLRRGAGGGQGHRGRKRAFLLDLPVKDNLNKILATAGIVGHLKEAYLTYARPLETDADFAKLEPFLDLVKDTDQDIIIICPRGGSGATRPFDYFKERGIAPERMLILQGGQEAYNKAYPDDVSH